MPSTTVLSVLEANIKPQSPLVCTVVGSRLNPAPHPPRWVCHDFPELKLAVENYVLNDFDPLCFDSMKQLCERYNRAVDNIRKLVSLFRVKLRTYCRPFSSTFWLQELVVHGCFGCFGC